MSKHDNKEAKEVEKYLKSMPFLTYISIEFKKSHWKHIYEFKGQVIHKVHGGQRQVPASQIQSNVRMDGYKYLISINKPDLAQELINAFNSF